MKDQSQAAIQFSGYPLMMVEPKLKTRQTGLTVVKPKPDQTTTSIQKNEISNDPRNWDVDWFGDYE
ncbi:MAG: hypothetical protein ACJ75B_09700 [Flavisolibacter sp.]